MRNALLIDDLVITTDNSGAIGEKIHDVVKVPDAVTSYYSARVAFLEQLAEGALPTNILMLNFSSEDAWQRYMKGIEQLFKEVELQLPRIQGSTESNIPTMQSGVGITMIGRCLRELAPLQTLKWYTYGRPLVGAELMENPLDVADLKAIVDGLLFDQIARVIPIGSKGLQHEVDHVFQREIDLDGLPFDVNKSAGPSTIVLLGIEESNIRWFEERFHHLINRII